MDLLDCLCTSVMIIFLMIYVFGMIIEEIRKQIFKR